MNYLQVSTVGLLLALMILYIWRLKTFLHRGRTDSEKLRLDILEAQTKNKYLESSLADEKKRRSEMESLDEKWREHFDLLANRALHRTHESLSENVDEIVAKYEKSMKQSAEFQDKSFQQKVRSLLDGLDAINTKVGSFEKDRISSFESLQEQIKHVNQSHLSLREQTSKLGNALSKPNVRGRWGEIHLKRVVELAGLKNNCDFATQASRSTVLDSGQSKTLRPDLIVQLPGDKFIAVDSKTPLEKYMAAFATEDAEKQRKLFREHAALVKLHINSLAKKNYWTALAASPEVTILFLPSDSILEHAMEHDPSLLEYGSSKNVILATPSSLIVLLKAVAVGWQQQQMSENSREILALTTEFRERMMKFASYLGETGGSLNKAVLAYNKLIGNFETRVVPNLKKFDRLSADSQQGFDLEVSAIESRTRELSASEFEGQ